MAELNPQNSYPPFEEKLNIISHGLGFAMSILGLVLLILRANDYGETVHLVSILIFGASMVLLYAASTFYHSARGKKLRYRLNILDHSSIYILIAGTYTPFALVTLNGTAGWIIFGVVWGMAFLGVILKLFFTGRYQTFSTIMYVLMGWVIVFAVKPLVENLSVNGLIWLFAGGISYTIGAVLFSLNRLKFNHAIFHIFVLFGTFCHFLSIYYYVLPSE
ncbi:PAQR family membrane homeostasis protein TrhA [Autumnicola musiva]|uniref:Hemolysin III family protein n=1 Tax=Autumnicola musiva TaxID=3075589 RepID=A0ABU3D550_9FLAO|nr:hemolysin III family protein [Zunongwangia sp. F117]MDT0676664.1 hemolysin III family protein [Zunongwangia sp. F117]